MEHIFHDLYVYSNKKIKTINDFRFGLMSKEIEWLLISLNLFTYSTTSLHFEIYLHDNQNKDFQNKSLRNNKVLNEDMFYLNK